jgi:hypothetical protein
MLCIGSQKKGAKKEPKPKRRIRSQKEARKGLKLRGELGAIKRPERA